MPRASRKRLKQDPEAPNNAGGQAEVLELLPPPHVTDSTGDDGLAGSILGIVADDARDVAEPISLKKKSQKKSQKKSPHKNNKGTPKRKAWSLAEKKELCRKFRDSDYTSLAKFLRKYNEERADDDKISPSNLHHWWKDCQRGIIRLDDLCTGDDEKVKRRRGAKFETVEMRLAIYIEDYDKFREKGVPALTGPDMLKKAKEFAEELGDTTFQGSKGWLWNFRRRNGLQKYLTKVDGQKQEELERLVTPGQVRDALSTLSTFAAQSGNKGLAVDVARLHQKLARLQNLASVSI